MVRQIKYLYNKQYPTLYKNNYYIGIGQPYEKNSIQDKDYNYSIKDLEDQHKAGEIISKQYVDALNNLEIEDPYIYHPIIYKNSGGGTMKPRRSYAPSDSIKRQIAEWEGDSMKTNRSFDAEARDFSQYLPEDAYDKLTQKQLDGLFSYSYNVGSSAFNARVVPVLTKYLNGKATAEQVQQSMWAAGDKKYRGLRKRRAAERAMFGGSGLYTTPTTSNSVENPKLIPKVPQEFTNFDNVAPADATMVAPLYNDNKVNYFK